MACTLILDGGLGTSLEQKYSCKFDKSTPLWSSDLLVSDPETLCRCQKDFGDVPVDIILTATYQVSIDGFSGTKSSHSPEGVSVEEIPRYLEAAVSIAERAKQDGAKVALSLGPYGACMIPSQEYSGKYDETHNSLDSLFHWHQERMRLFSSVKDISSRIKYISLETIPRVDEIVAMRKALDTVPQLSQLPFWMSCLYPGEDETLPNGDSIEDALHAMFDPAAAKCIPWGVGINCTKVWKLDSLLRRYENVIEQMVQKGTLGPWPALVLYPDGTNGEVYNTTTQKWEVPDDVKGIERVAWETQLSDIVKATQSRGDWKQIIVGGCCMAGSEDIKRLRDKVLNGE